MILRGRLSAIRYSGPLLVEVLAKMLAEVLAEVFELLVEVEVRKVRLDGSPYKCALSQDPPRR